MKKDGLDIRADRFHANVLSKAILFANKQPLNPQQSLGCSKNIFTQCNLPCHKPLCNICTRFVTGCGVRIDNNVIISIVEAGCHSQNVIDILFCPRTSDAIYVSEISNRFRLRLNNHKHNIKSNSPGNATDTENTKLNEHKNHDHT